METVCQVAFKLMTLDEGIRAEKILREYLLNVSDRVRMERSGSSYLDLLSFIPHPSKFKKFTSMLKQGDVIQKGDHHWEFNVTDNIKNLLNQATLFLKSKKTIFYGFTDPKFFKQEHELASFMSSDKLLLLYIPDSDKAMLAAQGVYMDSPEM